MATVAARLPRERSIRVKPAWVVVVSAVAAVGVYMAVRFASIAARLSQATRACSDRPLDATAFRTFPLDELCPDLEVSDVVVCRSMQKYLRGLDASPQLPPAIS